METNPSDQRSPARASALNRVVSWQLTAEENIMHTPGTWYVDAHPSGLRVLSDDERGTIVCHQIGPASNAEAMSDARLIASAPAMYALLKSLRPKVGLSSELGKRIGEVLESAS
jgi:hypothetical protein